MKCINFMQLKEKFSNLVRNMLLAKMCQKAINFRSHINCLPADTIIQNIFLTLKTSVR